MSVRLIRRSTMHSNEKINWKYSSSGVRADGSFNTSHIHVKEYIDCYPLQPV